MSLYCDHGMSIWEPCAECIAAAVPSMRIAERRVSSLGHYANEGLIAAEERETRLRLLLVDCARYISGGPAQFGRADLLRRIEKEIK